MASTIQLRVDDDLKNKSDELFKDLGTDTTTAIRMFLKQAIAVNGFPFEIKRVYYMYDTGVGVERGFHAHKCLQQILICIHGSCKIRLDNGKEKKVVPLEKPYEGLYVSNVMWREMFDFSPDAVLLVLASELYDESDYRRNYDEFLKFIGNDNE